MNSVRFGMTSLLGTNLVGNLKRDNDGYLDVVVGGLNVYNAAGQYYVFEEAKHLFESSSQLMRRVKRGALRGEYGHPKRQVNQRMEEYIQRVLVIHEENVCCHFSELTLDFDRIKDANGRPIVAIIAKVIPSGPMGAVLERSLQNKRENVCFSIRSFTDDIFDGMLMKRILKTVVTFDYVNEPGIAIAEKFKSPSLESFGNEVVVGRGELERGLQLAQRVSLGQESATLSAQELFTNMGWETDNQTIQAFAKTPAWKGW